MSILTLLGLAHLPAWAWLPLTLLLILVGLAAVQTWCLHSLIAASHRGPHGKVK